jgi:hypothetical protein
MLISLAGGALGLLGNILLLHRLSAWRPMPNFPTYCGKGNAGPQPLLPLLPSNRRKYENPGLVWFCYC